MLITPCAERMFAQQPRVFTVRPPLDQALAMSSEVWRMAPGMAAS
ncbi:hypothetical protein [Paradevosia shaoguanensis]|nr:hypothetical protein [Paradevosia shaoguanensis]